MELIVSSAMVFILIMDPFGNVPLFLAALAHTAPERRRRWTSCRDAIFPSNYNALNRTTPALTHRTRAYRFRAT